MLNMSIERKERQRIVPVVNAIKFPCTAGALSDIGRVCHPCFMEKLRNVFDDVEAQRSTPE